MMKDNHLNRNNYCIELVDESNTHLIGKIRGAPDTPFQYGVFKIDITIPDKYPFEPPVCKFLTKVWHPNISSQTGVICLDILKDQWAAAMTIESILTSLQSFLSSPEPADPQDAVVANQFQADRELYNRTARYWTYTYAVDAENRQKFDKNDFKEFDEKIEKLRKSVAIDVDKAMSTLSCANWNLEKAVANK